MHWTMKPSLRQNKPHCYTSQLKYVFLLEESGLCRGSKLTNSLGQTKLTNSLGKQQLEVSTCTWSGHASWNHSKFLSQPASRKQFLRRLFFSFFLWVWRYNKTCNDWSCRKQWVLFPLYLSVLRGKAEPVSGKQNSLFPLGPVIKCSLSAG